MNVIVAEENGVADDHDAGIATEAGDTGHGLLFGLQVIIVPKA